MGPILSREKVTHLLDPSAAIDSLAPVVGLDALERHLHDLLQSDAGAPNNANADAAAGPPPLLLNAALLDDVSLQLTEAHVLLLAPRLLPLLVAVLRRPITTAVPPVSSSSSSSPSSSAAAAAAASAAAATAATTAVASLATKLLAPVTYAQALTLASAADLVDALGADAAPATNVLRALLRAATADDALLAAQLRSLPERTVPDEADDLRAWLREVLPASATRVANWAEE
ncbi:hypothetical protein SPI_00134 [Niveomyces insectorum RCEF 264]|uniref:Uncharacterized protein n=1 Tax=Niveomyces insectorum RCEF 264 TaxID=1081102 RepID=A0A167ZV28_9HYPO|nr:hypothetical protein SPI_00134 [Niveomyces insectorum RCEF 264]